MDRAYAISTWDECASPFEFNMRPGIHDTKKLVSLGISYFYDRLDNSLDV